MIKDSFLILNPNISKFVKSIIIQRQVTNLLPTTNILTFTKLKYTEINCTQISTTAWMMLGLLGLTPQPPRQTRNQDQERRSERLLYCMPLVAFRGATMSCLAPLLWEGVNLVIFPFQLQLVQNQCFQRASQALPSPAYSLSERPTTVNN